MILTDPNRPLKIAHLALTALPATVGGLEVVVASLVRHQRAKGHEVHLVTRWKQWRAAKQAGEANVLALPPRLRFDSEPFRSVGPRWPVALASKFHQMRHRFDIWHIHWLYPTGWMAHDGLRKTGVPVIMTAHGADLQTDESTKYGYRLYSEHDMRIRSLVPKAQALSAISASIEKSYLDLGAQPERIHRIGNGVDVAHIEAARAFRHETRAKYGITSDTALILSVGRNQPSKGLHFIPEVLRRLKDRNYNVIWFIVGQDSEKLAPALEKAGVRSTARLLPKFGAGSLLHFPPDDLARLYGASDIFAFPSMSEGAPLVAIEAMAAGSVLVGNDVQGIRDTIDHEVDGLLCEAANPAAMADAISRILDSRPLHDRLQVAGFNKARARDWSGIAEEYLALYRSLKGAPPA